MVQEMNDPINGKGLLLLLTEGKIDAKEASLLGIQMMIDTRRGEIKKIPETSPLIAERKNGIMDDLRLCEVIATTILESKYGGVLENMLTSIVALFLGDPLYVIPIDKEIRKIVVEKTKLTNKSIH